MALNMKTNLGKVLHQRSNKLAVPAQCAIKLDSNLG
jgi:hypothetical protein